MNNSHKNWARSPFWWARLGAFSIFLTRMSKTLQPPVLILSIPRGGSSWLGEVLGSASNALYLSEPITQSDLAFGHTKNKSNLFDPEDPPPLYKQFADRAFSGLPTFPLWLVIRKPPQWRFSERSQRRVVIKEVKPHAVKWLVTRYQPIVFLIVRHPAAIALSYQKMGWKNIFIEKEPLSDRKFVNTSLAKWHDKLLSMSNFWEKQGIMQGAILSNLLDGLNDYPNHKIVIYEELCKDPLNTFKDFFQFSGLSWDENIENLIAKRSSGGESHGPYSTTRNSMAMIDSWKGKISKENIERLKKAFCAFNLPWYGSKNDW